MVVNNKLKIGIVQGRLVPPVEGNIQAFPHKDWEKEFTLVKEAGYDGLEWIFDGEENPLWSEEGRKKMRTARDCNQIEIPSISADYLMYNPIFGNTKSKSVEILKKLILFASEIGILRINVPLEDQSQLKNSADVEDAVDSLRACLSIAEKENIILATESSLPPMNFFAFMKKVDHPNFKINYDLGNSCACGYPTDFTLKLLAPYLVGIHIKDRKNLYGRTVALGTGDTDLCSNFQTLKEIGYDGYYVIQGARGEDDLLTAKTYANYVNKLLYQF